MFTLKLYRRPPNRTGVTTRIIAVEGVDTIPIDENLIELRAYAPRVAYLQLYIGRRQPEFTAVTDENHWDWGLLENAAGKTTEHFRPWTYG